MDLRYVIPAAAVVIGGFLFMDSMARSKTRPSLRQPEAVVQKEDKLENIVQNSQDWIVNEKEVSVVFKSNKIPAPIKIHFDNINTLYVFQKDLLVPLREDYKEQIGDRGFTGYELFQLIGRYVDLTEFGGDIRKVTGTEVKRVIEKYKSEKKDGFKLALDKIVEPEKTPVADKKEALEDHKKAEDKEYEGFKAGQKYEKGYRRGVKYTREQLDAYNAWREGSINRQINSRIYSPYR